MSLTVSLEALSTTVVIYAYERRDVGTLYVPGSYIYTKSPKEKHVPLKLRGDFVEIMCEINQEQLNNVVYEGGIKVMYLQLLQAIYGCIELIFLWYELFTNKLVSYVFNINPCNKRVAKTR